MPLVYLQLSGNRLGEPTSMAGFIGIERVHFWDKVALNVVPERFADVGSQNQFLADIDYLRVHSRREGVGHHQGT